MTEVENDINRTKEFLKSGREKFFFVDFKSYSPVFLDTNEEMIDYLKDENINGRALTVCASGDHIFNLLCKGVEEIDSFDINKVSYYYYKLKCAWILQHSYKEFLDFYFLIPNEEQEVFRLDKLDDLSFIDDETYQYFSSLKNEEVSKLCYGRDSSYYVKQRSIFYDENQYEKLRSIIRNGFDFKFFHSDLSNLDEKLNGKYQYMCLSNIGDYMDRYDLSQYYKLKEYLQFCKDKIFPFLDDDGKAMFYYLFNLRKEEDTEKVFNEQKEGKIKKIRTYNGNNAYIYNKK